jgi:hypothetical protein
MGCNPPICRSSTVISTVSAPVAKSSRRLEVAIVLCGLLTGFLTAPILNYIDSLAGLNIAHGSALALGAVPFGVLVAIIARIAAAVGGLRASMFGILTLVIASVAITLSADTNAALGSIAEPQRELIGGPVGGVVGSGLMALAAIVLRIGPLHPIRWLPMVAVGTVLGLLLALDVWLDSQNVWVLFPVWQGSIALIFLRTLQNAKR